MGGPDEYDDTLPPVAHSTDLDLVQRALAGNRSAREEFVARMRCVPRILTVKGRRLAQPLTDDEIGDLAQDTLVAIWRRLDSFEGRAALETWVYRFCHFELARFLRTRSRRPASHEYHEELHAAVGDPELVDRERLFAAIEGLDPQQAEVVRLRHFEQLSFEQVGERVGLGFAAAKAQYYRALARMRERLDPTHEGAQG